MSLVPRIFYASLNCGSIFFALDRRLMAIATKRWWAITNSGNAWGKKEESLMWSLRI